MNDELLAEHVDATYGVPREEFTAERDRRARQLRDAGHAEEAAALRRHRRPTVAAWAVDQLARRQASEVAALIAAGEELRDAQRRAMSGAASAGLLQATRRVRDLASQLRGAARDLIEGAGSPPDPHLDEVEQTLFAAAVDPAHHGALRRGVLSAALQAAGFGDVEGLALVAAPAADDGDADEAAAEQDRAAEQQRRARRRELEPRASELRRRRIRQQQRVEQASGRAEELRARADQAAQEAKEAHDELDRLDEEIQAAQDELHALEGDATRPAAG